MRAPSLGSIGFLSGCTGLLIGLFVLNAAVADEFSLTPDSTVIGRNYGYPSGTPSQGETLVDRLDLVVETCTFFKNLELSGFDEDTGIEGETFIGFLLPLRARYRPHETLTFELGGVVGHNFKPGRELRPA